MSKKAPPAGGNLWAPPPRLSLASKRDSMKTLCSLPLLHHFHWGLPQPPGLLPASPSSGPGPTSRRVAQWADLPSL